MRDRLILAGLGVVCLMALRPYWSVVVVAFPRTHTLAAVFTWLFMPVVAGWLSTSTPQHEFAPHTMRLFRTVLSVLVISLSIGFYMRTHDLRDFVGQRFVAGYSARQFDDTDDEGRPIVGEEWTATHWYGRWGLYALNLTCFGVCAGMPLLTWALAQTAVRTRGNEA